jgi:hypothetical protein
MTTGGGESQDLFGLYQYGTLAGFNFTFFYNLHTLVDSLGYGLE